MLFLIELETKEPKELILKPVLFFNKSTTFSGAFVVLLTYVIVQVFISISLLLSDSNFNLYGYASSITISFLLVVIL